MKKRFLSLLLVICLVAGLMPTAVFAAGTDTGKAIQLGTSGISGYDSAAGYDYIYFGNWTAQDTYTTSGPIKWRVLDDRTNTGETGLFLLSDGLLGTGYYGGVYFANTSPYSNTWQGSDAQAWCNTFASSNLDSRELAAILETTKSDDVFISSTYSVPFAASEKILNGDKVFFLSAEEAENSAYGFANDNARIANYGNSAGVWWLRSPYAYDASRAGAVYGTGDVDSNIAYDDCPARPAFNLDLNSVLFTSAAVGGKSSGAAGADAIFEIGDYTGSEWKLTLLDNSRNFAVTEKTASGKPGDTITLNYSGATTGTNEYISVIIADNSGAQYYGRVAQPTTESGTVSVTIPANLADGTYTLYVFSEQYNGDYMTNYASAFAEVALTVEEAAAPGIDTGKAIQLVDSGTAANIGGGQADNIYFGTYQQSSDGSGGYNTDPIKWRVLENANGQLFLLSDQNLDVFQYHTDYESVTWETSTMRSWLNGYSAEQNTGGSSGTDYTSDNFIGAAFSEKEQGAIADTTVVNDDNPDYSTEGGNDTTDKIFLLSIEEVQNADYGFADNSSGIATNTAYVAGGGKLGTSYMNGVGEADYWWLRSPGDIAFNAALVTFYGGVFSSGFTVYNDYLAVRPAFHLDLTSVLFTSAAAGGKSASGMDSGLTAIGDYDGSEWKLTLLDNSRNFAVTEKTASGKPGDTITLNYSDATTGTNEYISVIIADNSGAQYYGRIAQPDTADGTAEVTIPADLAVGTYTLYVFSEQYNGDYMTDYASALQEISLNVLSKETTPQAVFTAAGDSSGTLSNVDASMKYSTDGGASWTDITGTTAEITGVTADKDIQVVKKGDGTATADSDAQIIDVTQAATPTGLGKTDCKTAAQNDGTITGVDSTMEYRLSAASEWTSISGNTVSGLANGTYEVRVRANGTVLSSEVATVTIGAHTCAAQGDWQHDANEHWKLCACGAEVDRAAHTGGEATCTEKAVCDICGSSYGAINPDNHTGEIVWTKTATAHSNKYSCCDAVVVAEEAHEWENGVCAECGYECQHDGGTATCTEKAVCDICGEEYGEVNAASHTNLVKTEDKAATHMTEGNIEYWYCDGCDKYFSDEAGTQEIALADTVIPKLTEHTADGSGWHSDEAGHWNTCECGEMLNEAAHTFEWVTDKEATAAEAGSKHEECTVCGYAKAAVEIPATGDNTQSPQTGDDSNIALWIAVMLAAGAVLTGTAVYSRKRKYSR